MCFLLATLMVQRFECLRLTELCANIVHFTNSLIDTIRCPPYRWCILWLHMVCIIHASSECVLMLNERCHSVAPCAQYSMECTALGDYCLRSFNDRYHKEDLIWTKTDVMIHLLTWGAILLATSPFQLTPFVSDHQHIEDIRKFRQLCCYCSLLRFIFMQ